MKMQRAKRRPLRNGIDVPVDFPDVTNDCKGRARCWIVCRSITLRPLGKSTVLIQPSDVRMGVEMRIQVFNPRTNSFDDAPADRQRTSSVAAYLDKNFDTIAKFHPELHHCKRMAALLALANWMLQGPLRGSQPVRLIPSYTLPQDFPDDGVPAISARHERGVQQMARLNTLKQDREREAACLDQMKQNVERAEQCYNEAKRRVDGCRVDHYSQFSVDSYNLIGTTLQSSTGRLQCRGEASQPSGTEGQRSSGSIQLNGRCVQ